MEHDGELPSWQPSERAMGTLSDDDGLETKTSSEQLETERSVVKAFSTASWTPSTSKILGDSTLNAAVALKRERHISWLTMCLKSLPASYPHHLVLMIKESSSLCYWFLSLSSGSSGPSGYSSLDASQPWILFWLTHSLDLLGALKTLGDGTLLALINRISLCQHPNGGFGGGQYQIPHLAPTYAAVSAILSVASNLSEEHRARAYQSIDRPGMIRFLRSLKQPNGSYIMHHNGESDVRASYCAMAVASMINIIDFAPDLSDKVTDYIIECQKNSFEGVPGGEIGNEGHGGYAYCALSAAVIIGEGHRLDLDLLETWAARRQMRLEGGFSGRSNKLVDCCYSFWLGAIFPLIDLARRRANLAESLARNFDEDGDGPLSFDQRALQSYILACCQHPSGGLFDKPGKGRDLYHTCYGLSGLSVAQYGGIIIGDLTNGIEKTDPEFNITETARLRAFEFYSKELLIGL